MNEISKKDKLVYYKFLNTLPKKINRLYFGKLKGKFKSYYEDGKIKVDLIIDADGKKEKKEKYVV